MRSYDDSAQAEVYRHVCLMCWFACRGRPNACPCNGLRFPSKGNGREVLCHIFMDFLQICLCTPAQEIMIKQQICMCTSAQWVMRIHQRAGPREFKMLSLLYSPPPRRFTHRLPDSYCLSWNVINEKENITRLFWSFSEWILLQDNQIFHDRKLFLVENHIKKRKEG